MTILKRYQNIILGVVLIALAFTVYSYFFTGNTAPILGTEAVTPTTAVDQDLISLLFELKGITLDDSIFADPTFRSLQDFSQALVPEPIGRHNPFAPLGSVSSFPPQPKIPTVLKK